MQQDTLRIFIHAMSVCSHSARLNTYPTSLDSSYWEVIKCWRSMPIVSMLPRRSSLSSYIVVRKVPYAHDQEACFKVRKAGTAQIAVYNQTGIYNKDTIRLYVFRFSADSSRDKLTIMKLHCSLSIVVSLQILFSIEL